MTNKDNDEFNRMCNEFLSSCCTISGSKDKSNINSDAHNSKIDNVNHPNHYKSTGNIECIDVMLAVFGVDDVKKYCYCNAFKYLWRFKNKNGLEDIKKARWYLDKYIELKSKK